MTRFEAGCLKTAAAPAAPAWEGIEGDLFWNCGKGHDLPLNNLSDAN
jgi:hypothetical protein